MFGLIRWLDGRLPIVKSKSLPFYLALLGVILCSPALGVGLQFDDYLHQETILAAPSATAVTADLFRFLPPDSPQKQQWLADGSLPWWTLPQATLLFWRPLTAWTHWLDYQLWPDTPALMHLQSLAWFGLLLAGVTVLYRHLLPSANVAALATWLYTLDDAHGFPVGWLANRNGVLAALFGCLTLLAYHKWRQTGWRWGGWLTPFLLLLGLLSAEAAVATLGYLCAYALFLDPAPKWQRVKALVPAIITTLGWLTLYRALGYHTAGTAYADPFAHLGHYLLALGERAPLLVMGQFTPIPAEIYILLAGWPAGVMWLLGWGVTLTLGWLVYPLLRTQPVARFFALGLGLALLPAVIIFPINRLLFFVGLGGMGLMALLLQQGLAGVTAVKKRLLAGLILTHLIIAPLTLPLNAYAPALLGNVNAGIEALPQEALFADQTMVIVNAPSAFYTFVIPLLRQQTGLPVPRQIRLLATSPYPVEVQRLTADTLQIHPQAGYLLGIDSLFRGRGYDLARGEVVTVPGLTIQVTSLTGMGRVDTAVFQFDTPLEDAQLRWFVWVNGGYQPFDLPEIGETVVVSIYR